MSHLHFSRLPRRLALLALPLWVTAAQAQTAPTAPAPTQKTPVTKVTPASFQSAFEGYKPYTDEKSGNWVQANDTVGKIGGWRVYAKEAREPDAAAGNAASTATGQGGKDARPEPVKSMPGSHMGHGGKP